jgi:hypothetical protein
MYVQVNIPMYAGNFSYVISLFHTKLIFSCMQGHLKFDTKNIFVADASENLHFRPSLSEDLQQCRTRQETR